MSLKDFVQSPARHEPPVHGGLHSCTPVEAIVSVTDSPQVQPLKGVICLVHEYACQRFGRAGTALWLGSVTGPSPAGSPMQPRHTGRRMDGWMGHRTPLLQPASLAVSSCRGRRHTYSQASAYCHACGQASGPVSHPAEPRTEAWGATHPDRGGPDG